MKLFRRHACWRRGVAAAALTAALLGAWLTVVHGSLGDDPACAAESGWFPLAIGTPTLSALGARQAPQHCALCHWLRSLRSTTADEWTVLALPAPTEWLIPDPAISDDLAVVVHLPARSPPVSA